MDEIEQKITNTLKEMNATEVFRLIGVTAKSNDESNTKPLYFAASVGSMTAYELSGIFATISRNFLQLVPKEQREKQEHMLVEFYNEMMINDEYLKKLESGIYEKE